MLLFANILRTSFLFYIFLLLHFCLFGQTYAEFKTEKSLERKVRLAEDLSSIYIVKDLDSVRVIGDELLHDANKYQHVKAINTAYFILGEYLSRTAREQEGLKLLRDAKNYYLSVEDFDRVTRVYNAIGTAYQKFGNYSEAIKWYKLSMKYGKQSSDEFITNLAQLNLAQAYQFQKKYDLALSNAEQYKDWVIQLGSIDQTANSFAVLGSIAMDQEKYEQATYYFEQCFKFAKDAGDNSIMGHAYTNLGITLFLKGELEESKNHFRKAIDYRTEVGDIAAVCDAYLNYGGILFEIGDLTEAERQYYVGLKIAQTNKKYANEVELLEAIREIYLINDQKKIANIDKQLEIARQKLEKINSTITEMDEVLSSELKRSERIRKSGFINDNTKWVFYVGIFALFIGFAILVFRKKIKE